MPKKIKIVPLFLLTILLSTMLLTSLKVDAQSNLEEGTYSIHVNILKDQSSEVSRMQDYVEQTGTVTIKNGKMYVTMTLKSSSDITQFKVEQHGSMKDAKVISSNQKNNTRDVQFEVADLAKKIPAWVSVYIESPGFLYDHDYDIQLTFDQSSMKKIKDSIPVEPSTKELLLYLNNKKVLSNGVPSRLNEAPYLKNKYTLVPLRFISENLGANVRWDGKTKTVTITDGDKTIKLVEGKKTVSVNGKTVSIDTAIEIKKGTTFVPLRFISEQLGAKVQWNQAQKSITIIK